MNKHPRKTDIVDRERRTKYAEQLRHFAAGILTVDEYEKRTDDLVFDSSDVAIKMIWGAIWSQYDDFKTDRLRGQWALGSEMRQGIERSILFLQTDLDYEWPNESHLDIAGCLTSGLTMCLNLATLGLLRSPLNRLFSPIYSHQWEQYKRRQSQYGDVECWPFLRRTDLEKAKQAPKYFTGICA